MNTESLEEVPGTFPSDFWEVPKKCKKLGMFTESFRILQEERQVTQLCHLRDPHDHYHRNAGIGKVGQILQD